MPRIINHNDYRRKELEAMAEEEGIDSPDNLSRYPNKASLAQAIMEALATLPPDEEEAAELAAFSPKVYWAVGPESLTLAPKIKHPAMRRGHLIRPKHGRYVAETPFEDQLINEQLVAKGLAFPEDPEELWLDENVCESCNYRPRSMKAYARHFRACHSIT